MTKSSSIETRIIPIPKASISSKSKVPVPSKPMQDDDLSEEGLKEEVYELAKEAIINKDFTKAEEICKKHIEKSPNNSKWYSMLGGVYKLKQKYRLSEKMFLKAIRLNPVNVEALYNFGDLCIITGDYSRGIETLEKSIKQIKKNKIDLNLLELATTRINFANSRIEMKKGGNLIKNKDFDKALECFNNALDYYPLIGQNYLNIASIYREQGDLKKSIKYLEKSIKIDPEYVKSYVNLGASLIELERYEEAQQILETALSLCNPEGEIAEKININLERINTIEED